MRRTILLADDSPTIQRLVTETFADGDFEIISVSNGDAAISTFEQIDPSIVLADIDMPGKNGFEICFYVKQHPSRASTPVVLLVGALETFDEANGRQVGAAASITKPFEPHALVKLVRSVIGENEALAPAGFASPEDTAGGSGTASPAFSAATDDSEDLLGLESIFQWTDARAGSVGAEGISEEDAERIADRVIQRLSVEIIEGIAWDVVPDIAEKVVREELKRINES